MKEKYSRTCPAVSNCCHKTLTGDDGCGVERARIVIICSSSERGEIKCVCVCVHAAALILYMHMYAFKQ